MGQTRPGSAHGDRRVNPVCDARAVALIGAWLGTLQFREAGPDNRSDPASMRRQCKS
jgi:hypothetical protein